MAASETPKITMKGLTIENLCTSESRERRDGSAFPQLETGAAIDLSRTHAIGAWRAGRFDACIASPQTQARLLVAATARMVQFAVAK
jgi:hypothetical protein